MEDQILIFGESEQPQRVRKGFPCQSTLNMETPTFQPN